MFPVQLKSSFVTGNFHVEFEFPKLYNDIFKKYSPKVNSTDVGNFGIFLTYMLTEVNLIQNNLQLDNLNIVSNVPSGLELEFTFFETGTLTVFKTFFEVYDNIRNKKIQKNDYIFTCTLFLHKTVKDLWDEQKKVLYTLDTTVEEVEVIKFHNCIPKSVGLKTNLSKTEIENIKTKVTVMFEYNTIQLGGRRWRQLMFLCWDVGKYQSVLWKKRWD